MEIRNFQAHKHLTVELDPNITTIVGRTDKGKSSVVRALQWLAFNRPTGLAIRRWGADRVGVRVWVDGHVVARQRGKGCNKYTVDDQTFKAFGADVPPAVQDALRLDQINVQQQHDPIFWLSASPGQVGKELNAVVNLELMDTVVGRLSKWLREAKTKVKVCLDLEQESNKERERLAYVTKFVKATERLQKASEDCDKKQQVSHDITNLLEDVTAAQKAHKKAAKRAKALTTAVAPNGEMAGLSKTAETAWRNAQTLTRVKSKLEAAKAKAERTAQEAQRTQKEFETYIKGKRCPLCQTKL